MIRRASSATEMLFSFAIFSNAFRKIDVRILFCITYTSVRNCCTIFNWLRPAYPALGGRELDPRRIAPNQSLPAALGRQRLTIIIHINRGLLGSNRVEL
jgi:hypothetical protein